MPPSGGTTAAAVDRRRSPWPPPLGARHSTPATHTHALPKLVRVMFAALTAAVVVLAVTVAVLTVWVAALRDARSHAQEEQQARIDSTFCSVLAELPADSPPLQRIRLELHCNVAQPGAPAGGLNP